MTNPANPVKKVNITANGNTDIPLAETKRWRVDVRFVGGTGATLTFFWVGTEADGQTAIAFAIPDPSDLTTALSLAQASVTSTSFLIHGGGTFRIACSGATSPDIEVAIFPA